MIAQGLSRISRTLDDTSYAFTSLDVSEKELTTCDEIAKYPHLQYINVSKNQLTDLSPLNSLENVVALNASENALQETPQLHSKRLQVVDLSGNQLTTLAGIQGPSVTAIDFTNNKIESLQDLESLTNLKVLTLTENQLIDLSTLQGELAAVEHLDLSSNPLTCVAGIEKFPSLSLLRLSHTSLEDIEPLSQIESLTALYFDETSLSRLEILSRLPKLQSLDGQTVSDEERLEAIELAAKDTENE